MDLLLASCLRSVLQAVSCRTTLPKMFKNTFFDQSLQQVTGLCLSDIQMFANATCLDALAVLDSVNDFFSSSVNSRVESMQQLGAAISLEL